MKSYVFALMIFLLFTRCNNNSDNTEHIENSPKNEYNFERGINRTELPWLEGGMIAQKKLLHEIKSVNCGFVRFTLSRDNLKDEVKQHILYCNYIGIKVLLCIKLGGIKVIYPPGTEARDEEGRFWNPFPHSLIDTIRYNSWIADVLNYFNDAGCRIDVIEIGNEFAWCDFNGDFPIMPKGEGFAFDESYDWEKIPIQIKQGIRKVGEITSHTKKAAGNIFKTNPPKVILGGLNWFQDKTWMINQGGTIMSPRVTLQILKGILPKQPNEDKNLLEYIDGIGLHFYPNCSYNANYDKMIQEAKMYLDDFMEPVQSVTNLPVYITEMGYRIEDYGVENDWKRYMLFRAFFDAMDQTLNDYNWKQLYIFSWDQGLYRLIDNGEILYTADNIFR